jgi:hypothetical protein
MLQLIRLCVFRNVDFGATVSTIENEYAREKL